MSGGAAGRWHGYAHDNTALFITPADDEHIGLYLQQGRDTQLAAVFVDPAMAQMVMDWLDESLAATAAANADLLKRLQTEQPLAFTAPPPADFTHDDFDGD